MGFWASLSLFQHSPEVGDTWQNSYISTISHVPMGTIDQTAQCPARQNSYIPRIPHVPRYYWSDCTVTCTSPVPVLPALGSLPPGVPKEPLLLAAAPVMTPDPGPAPVSELVPTAVVSSTPVPGAVAGGGAADAGEEPWGGAGSRVCKRALLMTWGPSKGLRAARQPLQHKYGIKRDGGGGGDDI